MEDIIYFIHYVRPHADHRLVLREAGTETHELPKELKPLQLASNVPPPGHKTQLCYSLTPLYFIFYSVNRGVGGDVASSSER